MTLEQRRLYNKLWRENHPDYKLSEYWKEKNREYSRKWRKRHPDKISLKVKRANLKRESTLQGRIDHRLRSRIRWALRYKRCFKTSRSWHLIGCDLDWLLAWLEVHFQPGMGWHNYGLWHVDHIRPCVSFDLSDPAEQKRCFHWTNLQPLWAADNIRKKDK